MKVINDLMSAHGFTPDQNDRITDGSIAPPQRENGMILLDLDHYDPWPTDEDVEEEYRWILAPSVVAASDSLDDLLAAFAETREFGHLRFSHSEAELIGERHGIAFTHRSISGGIFTVLGSRIF
jgi:hypothetical protein